MVNKGAQKGGKVTRAVPVEGPTAVSNTSRTSEHRDTGESERRVRLPA